LQIKKRYSEFDNLRILTTEAVGYHNFPSKWSNPDQRRVAFEAWLNDLMNFVITNRGTHSAKVAGEIDNFFGSADTCLRSIFKLENICNKAMATINYTVICIFGVPILCHVFIIFYYGSQFIIRKSIQFCISIAVVLQSIWFLPHKTNNAKGSHLSECGLVILNIVIMLINVYILACAMRLFSANKIMHKTEQKEISKSIALKTFREELLKRLKRVVLASIVISSRHVHPAGSTHGIRDVWIGPLNWISTLLLVPHDPILNFLSKVLNYTRDKRQLIMFEKIEKISIHYNFEPIEILSCLGA